VTSAHPIAEHVPPEDEEIVIGDLSVWPERFVATWRGKELQLTQKEMLLLMLFVRNRGRMLRREVIAAHVWDGSAPGRTIDLHVARLRAKLPRTAITTVIRVGYRFTL
jgi:DNA-binding response OmpR family regulator